MTYARYDFSWTSRQTVAVLALLAVWGAALLAAGAARPVRLGESLLVDRDKVSAVTEKINPNVATVASLRRLAGIGPVRAAAITDYAAKAGGRAFAEPQDLAVVAGIGPGTVEQIAPFLVFAPQEK